MKRVQSYSFSKWKPSLSEQELNESIQSLENGAVLYFPNLSFSVKAEEKALFSSNLVKSAHQSIRYTIANNKLRGCRGSIDEENIIHNMMKRFASYAKEFIEHLLPHYKKSISMGDTYFKPIEVKGQQSTSYKKNKSLLHIDSLASTPTHGKRILRFFANANPFDIPRVWRLGDSYKQVIKRFLPHIKGPALGSRTLMNRLGITKSYRILYDHYMLHIHDRMKSDELYQKKVDQEIFEFAPSTCWLAFTDQVSHAVISGQYVLEQNFYLPAEAQLNPDRSPLVYMEKLFQKSLRN